MTLCKLSLRNAKRQAQDYLVYFATIVMSAALMYAFNGLVFSEELLHLSEQMKALPVVVTAVSAVVVGILGWLVSYTANFMLSRRSRELGTYILIGLENRQVAQLFFLENLAVGGTALLAGLLLGNVLFQALRAMILALFGTAYHFHFSFSLRAIGLTLVYFWLIYLFAQTRCRKRIRSMHIRDLIYFDRKNEEAMIQSSGKRRKTFAVSIVLGIIGTLLILARGSLLTGMIGAACIIVFLYGFFASFSSGVPAWFETHPVQKFRGQNMLVFRFLSAKLAAIGIILATVSLLFTATLIAQGSGLTFSNLFRERVNQTSRFDLFISCSPAQSPEDYMPYIQENIPIQDSWSYDLYLSESRQLTQYCKETSMFLWQYGADMVMKFSDYAALRKMLGDSEVTLEPGSCIVHCAVYLQEHMENYDLPITVGGCALRKTAVNTEFFNQYMWDGNGTGFIIVVPDEIAGNCAVTRHIFAAMTADRISEEQDQGLRQLRNDDRRLEYDTIEVRSTNEREAASMVAALVFPLYYLALILTMTAAAILTIQQLSETERFRQHFALLRKLGMERREMAKVLRTQFAVFYTMPAIPPVLIAAPFILELGGAVEPGILVKDSAPPAILGITLAVFFLIYTLYIVLAYSSLKRNVLPE